MPGRTLGDALAEFRLSNGLPDAADRMATWSCRLGPLELRLPNFRWRRAAILRHDLHHVLTGYPCGLLGECQVAAWEFAAGPFPHLGAKLFCLPLVAVGVVWSPTAIWRAFRAGRARKSLYGVVIDVEFLDTPLALVRERTRRTTRETARLPDSLAFLAVVMRSFAVVLLPVAALGLTVAVF